MKARVPEETLIGCPRKDINRSDEKSMSDLKEAIGFQCPINCLKLSGIQVTESDDKRISKCPNLTSNIQRRSLS